MTVSFGTPVTTSHMTSSFLREADLFCPQTDSAESASSTKSLAMRNPLPIARTIPRAGHTLKKVRGSRSTTVDTICQEMRYFYLSHFRCSSLRDLRKLPAGARIQCEQP